MFKEQVKKWLFTLAVCNSSQPVIEKKEVFLLVIINAWV